MNRRFAALVFAAVLVVPGCATVVPGMGELATDTVMVQAKDPGIQLHLRNKRLAALDRFAPEKIVLFVHGATFPSETAFDIDLPGGSWMEHAAKRGFDAWIVDVRGYGRSTRPAAMDQPPAANAPFADTKDAVRDVGAAVEHILKLRGATRLNLVGWSWGTTIMAGYAAENPAQVEKLVLYAPVWHIAKPPPYAGAYRTSNGEQTRPRRGLGTPAGRLAESSPVEWFDKWWAANLATDPAGAARNPPVLRSPNGVMKDLAEVWGRGRSTYDPAAIRAPTLLAVGEWDGITPPAMAQALFKQLSNARERRLVVFSEGSHAIVLERNRMRLIREVQNFLEEPSDRPAN